MKNPLGAPTNHSTVMVLLRFLVATRWLLWHSCGRYACGNWSTLPIPASGPALPAGVIPQSSSSRCFALSCKALGEHLPSLGQGADRSPLPKLIALTGPEVDSTAEGRVRGRSGYSMAGTSAIVIRPSDARG